MSFDAKDYSIGEILNRSVFSIPRNQRKYVWNYNNWQDLFSDVIFSIVEEKPHFIGSIVLEGRSEKKRGLSYYTVIDGQQRLTTITLLLIAIMKHFSELNMQDEFQGTVSYLRSKDDNNKDSTIIDSNYHISIDRLVNGIISIDKNISIENYINMNILAPKDKTLGDAIKYFYDAIKNDINNYINPQLRVDEIRKAVLDMRAVKITSSNEEDSYTIFEILNARGQELADFELLKNYIMRYIQPTQRRDEAKEKWEELERTLGTAINRYVNHYTTHKLGDYKSKHKSAYTALQRTTRPNEVSALFDDIILKSNYYDYIIHPTKAEDGILSPKEIFIYEFFRKNKFIQFRPILISLIHQKNIGNITKEKYESILNYLYGFFVCYILIGDEKSNTLQDMSLKYARQIEVNCSSDLLDAFIDELKKKMPDYTMFKNSFENIGYSKHINIYNSDRNKRKVQIVLELIERHLSPTGTCDTFTIEHMNPDYENSKNAKIGNLIPLEKKINDSLKDKTLDEKLLTYQMSSFTTTRNVAKRIIEKGLNIDSRTSYLAEMVYSEILRIPINK